MRTRQMDESQRGQGFTTLQMRRAPNGALYIWPASGSLHYARLLAKFLGRDDLEIVNTSILERDAERLRGRTLTGIVLDHAIEATGDELDLLRALRKRLVRRAA